MLQEDQQEIVQVFQVCMYNEPKTGVCISYIQVAIGSDSIRWAKGTLLIAILLLYILPDFSLASPVFLHGAFEATMRLPYLSSACHEV